MSITEKDIYDIYNNSTLPLAKSNSSIKSKMMNIINLITNKTNKIIPIFQDYVFELLYDSIMTNNNTNDEITEKIHIIAIGNHDIHDTDNFINCISRFKPKTVDIAIEAAEFVRNNYRIVYAIDTKYFHGNLVDINAKDITVATIHRLCDTTHMNNPEESNPIINCVLTISSKNISENTLKILDDISYNSYNSHVYRKSNQGYFIYIDSFNNTSMKTTALNDLKNAFALAQKYDCNVLCIDEKGLITDELKLYDID